MTSSNAAPPINQQKLSIQDLLTSTEKHIHNMFIAGIVFGALSCFARADYNLPMFAFLYIMWEKDDVSYSTKLTFALERQI